MPSLRAALITLLAGAASVLSFAPFGAWWLVFGTTAGMLYLVRLQTARLAAAGLGFLFGLGMFLAGVGWVYLSMADYGGIPPLLAATLTLAFCAYLAAFHSLFAACAWSLRAWPETAAGLTVAGLWSGGEWLRGELGGLPWLSLGYSQVPSSPLAGYLPVLGVYGAGAFLIFAAWALSSMLARRLRLPYAIAAIGLVLVLGASLEHVPWTRPTGVVTSVALLQGNVEQDIKWRPEHVNATLEQYAAMVERTSARLVVLPETALPLFADEIAASYLQRLRRHVEEQGALLAFGVVERQASPAGTQVYNSTLGVSSGETMRYRKHRLVPFGEYVPFRPLLRWALGWIEIPMSDMTPGHALQEPWSFDNQRIAVNICFEDVFGSAIARAAKPSTLLVNLSNLAWFGSSVAAAQHLQIAQARSLETGRYSARATNTGSTAVIDNKGRIIARLQEHLAGTLVARVEGFSGTTPYMRWADWPIVLWALLALMTIILKVRRFGPDSPRKRGQ